MAKAGYCSACAENVYLTEQGECSKGHPVNCISGVYDTDQPKANVSAAAQPPVAAQVPAKVKKPFYKKWWVWAIAVLVVAIAAAGSSGTPDAELAPTAEAPAPAATTEPAAKPAAAPATKSSPKPADKTPSIGDALEVGDLVFTANDAKATKELKSILGNKSGNWIVVKVTVENHSKEAVMLDSSFFKLIDKDGATFETDSDGLMYIDEKDSLFLEKVNPKMSKTGKVLFAVPGSTKPSDYTLQVQTGFWGTETGEIALTK